MIKQKRYEKILDILQGQHAVSIEELCNQLAVSMATVRRDLIYLDEQKMLKRTHGGAVSVIKPAIESVPITMRNRMYKPQKARIARAAVDLIRDGSTIFVGAGSTMQELAALLGNFSHLTVVTNDVGVAYAVSQTTANRLIVSGGTLKPATSSLSGSFAENTLRDLRMELAFLSTAAVTAQGFMDLDIEEVVLKRMVIKNARRTVMLCDQSKFHAEAFMNICPLSTIALTLTNDDLDPQLEKRLQDGGITLQVV